MTNQPYRISCDDFGTTRYRYQRICPNCGDKAMVGYKPKPDTLCKTCNRKELASVMHIAKHKNHVPVRYTYFCPTCPKVHIGPAKHKTAYCQKCSRAYVHRIRESIPCYFDFGTMKIIGKGVQFLRYFRVCVHCEPNEQAKEVKSKSQAGFRPCNKHKHIGKPPRKPRCKSVYKPRKKKAKEPSKDSIDRYKAKQQEYVEQQEELEAKKVVIPKQKISDEDMMAQFLAKNEVTTIPDGPDHSWSGVMNIEGAY